MLTVARINSLKTTMKPTVDPTTASPPFATGDPTIIPSTNPSMIPTFAPTTKPTDTPTDDLTTTQGKPAVTSTTTSTIMPTSKVTMSSTEEGGITHVTGHIFTSHPSIGPSVMDNGIETAERQNTFDHQAAGIPDNYMFFVSLSIILIAALCLIITLMDAKCWRINDFFHKKFVIRALVGFLDVFSDAAFAARVTVIHLSLRSVHSFVMMAVSLAFIILPIGLSLIQLLRATHRWRSNDQINAWLIHNATMLFFMSLATGSSFNAIAVVNCNAFKLELFSMGLSRKEILQWNNQRIWSVIFLEVFCQIFISKDARKQMFFLVSHCLMDFLCSEHPSAGHPAVVSHHFWSRHCRCFIDHLLFNVDRDYRLIHRSTIWYFASSADCGRAI